MFKDKDKQREANAERQRRYKAKQKALPEKGVTDEKALLSEGVTGKALPVSEPKTAEEAHKLLRSINYGQQDEVLPPTTPYPGKPKRGKDVKSFADLPPDIQQTINTLSDDQTEHKRRTAIAINYQHQFPDRYHSTGCDVFKRRQGKPGVI